MCFDGKSSDGPHNIISVRYSFLIEKLVRLWPLERFMIVTLWLLQGLNEGIQAPNSQQDKANVEGIIL